MDMLGQAGFSRIERRVHRADGKSSALDCIMPEAWNQYGRSFLQIISPDIPEYERSLADSDRHPQSAVIWSAPTPEGGIEGELVTFDSLASDLSDAKGKWVFLESRSVDINGPSYRALAQAGAAGLVLTNFAVAETSPDDVVWFNGQGFNSWYHEKEAPRLPVGPVFVEVDAVDASGKQFAQSGRRTFYRNAPFNASYPARVCSYAECAQKTYDYLFQLEFIQELAEGKMNPDYPLSCYPSKMLSSVIRGMVNYAEMKPEKDRNFGFLLILFDRDSPLSCHSMEYTGGVSEPTDPSKYPAFQFE